MIKHNQKDSTVYIENSVMSFQLNYANGLQIESLYHRSSCLNWLNEKVDFFLLELFGNKIPSSNFNIVDINHMNDEVQEFVSFDLLVNELDIKSRVSLITENEESITMLIQMGANWDQAGPQNLYLHMPIFERMQSDNRNWYLSSNPTPKPDGTSAMQLHREFQLPICNIDENNHGFSMELRNNGLYSHIWNQNRNCDLIDIVNSQKLINNKILLRISDSEYTDVIEVRFFALSKGWPEAFDSWKKRIRKEMDLSEYERTDLEWYKKVVFQHFTFAFSKEVFDYQKKEFIPEKLIEDGLDFGGYDSILLWFQYPRLGVDERTQWDFNKDIPNGLDGMMEFTRRCHKKGVKVFLPYKPWDIRFDESPIDIVESMVEVVKKTGIDGIWFDTMNTVPEGFREKVDNIRPGVLFCTEGFPASHKSVETITGSWDQHWGESNMPETFIFRYLFPENNAPITSRWKVGESKDLFIKRAIFNGTGVAIWQDVFGVWLPFNTTQRADLKKWKNILLENFDIYFGRNPIPLFPSLNKNLYINRFMSDNSNEYIFSIYNASNNIVIGKLVNTEIDSIHIEELWCNRSIINDKGLVTGEINAREILILKIKVTQ